MDRVDGENFWSTEKVYDFISSENNRYPAVSAAVITIKKKSAVLRTLTSAFAEGFFHFQVLFVFFYISRTCDADCIAGYGYNFCLGHRGYYLAEL